jgi:hypothetical protein
LTRFVLGQSRRQKKIGELTCTINITVASQQHVSVPVLISALIRIAHAIRKLTYKEIQRGILEGKGRRDLGAEDSIRYP